MTERGSCHLNFSKKLLLGGASLVAVAFPVVLGGLANSTRGCAQLQAQNTGTIAPAFEVASIRPDKPGDRFMSVSMMFDADGYSATGITVKMLIKGAYGVDYSQISGAPDWINSERYEIEARIDSSASDALRKLDEDQREHVQKGMIQALLEDRFRLALHRETKELPVYSLVIAKHGPKLHEAKPEDTHPGLPEGLMQVYFLDGRITGQGVALKLLVERLSAELGHIVVDKTGLSGRYDFTLQCAPGEIRALSDGDGWAKIPPSESSGPSLFTALQEQLGLKLESQKAPVEILVIDHVEKPSAN